MTFIISIVLVFILFALGGIHFYWAIGGKWAFDNSLPQKENGEKVLNPKAIDCLIVSLMLFAFGLLVLIKSKIILFNLPTWLNHYGLYILAFLFILRAIGDFKYVGFSKKIKQTPFGSLDTKIYSPLCLLIGILLLVLEIISAVPNK
jgi:hypothetical protein